MLWEGDLSWMRMNGNLLHLYWSKTHGRSSKASWERTFSLICKCSKTLWHSLRAHWHQAKTMRASALSQLTNHSYSSIWLSATVPPSSQTFLLSTTNKRKASIKMNPASWISKSSLPLTLASEASSCTSPSQLTYLRPQWWTRLTTAKNVSLQLEMTQLDAKTPELDLLH